MRATTALGRHGEDLAADHLSGQGMTLLARNWRCRLGEVDLVAQDGPAVVFAEVKTRRGAVYGSALDAVTPRKVARYRSLAHEWLAVRAAAGEPRFEVVRFDVVAVTFGGDRGVRVEHLRGAFA